MIVLPDEAALIAHALDEPPAFAALYDRYAARVYTYIRYRVDDRLTADDLTAQTFEKALVNLKNYRAEQAPFGAWLFGIAHHVVSRHHRLERLQHWLSLDIILNRVSDLPPPEEDAIRSEGHKRLMLAVTQLRAHERNIIALKFAAGLNNRQIAAITGFSPSNVGVILYRAIQQLRVFLSESDS